MPRPDAGARDERAPLPPTPSRMPRRPRWCRVAWRPPCRTLPACLRSIAP